MPTRCELKEQEDKFKNFWEFKAGRYPLPFDPKPLATTNMVIDMVKGKGVVIADKRILDIGCGMGIYALPLAKEAGSIVGLDFSEVMLTKLTDEAVKYKIGNVDTVKTSWKDFNVDAMEFRKSFDIVWASMTMAVKDEDDIKKMELCSKKWCVYIGWGAKRDNAIMQEVFTLHGLKFGPPQGASAIYNTLKNMGRKPTLDFFETSWDWDGTVEEAVEEIAGHVEMHGGTPLKPQILEIVSRYAKDKVVKHTTFAEEGLIIWDID